MVFQITVVINHELQREILGFGDGIRVISGITGTFHEK